MAKLATSLGTVLRVTVEAEVEEAATEAEDTAEEDTEEVQAVEEAEVCSPPPSLEGRSLRLRFASQVPC